MAFADECGWNSSCPSSRPKGASNCKRQVVPAFAKPSALFADPIDVGGIVPRRSWVVDDSFEVHLRRSGRTFTVPQEKTILRTLLDAGVDADFSCSMGGCGTCETRLVEGIPDHRDNYLTDEEKATNKVIMICCSRSKSPVLVLDL